jgi:hypothetical protein
VRHPYSWASFDLTRTSTKVVISFQGGHTRFLTLIDHMCKSLLSFAHFEEGAPMIDDLL